MPLDPGFIVSLRGRKAVPATLALRMFPTGEVVLVMKKARRMAGLFESFGDQQ